MEENKEFKYDAFISYRHTDLDKFVATNLHRILESYDLPKEIKQKLNIKNKAFKRVFRDQEELPLSSNLEDPILQALQESKYLIVICSPRLNESLWCKKEIETFKKLRGRKNIFCVLIEGEPDESFPEEVLYDEKNITLKNGKTKKEKVLVEPLAADIRGKNKKDVLKKLKTEKLRLIAPMYNLGYDDLRQRHKLMRQKKIITTAVAIAIACILFAIYSIAMFIKIEMQQNVLAKDQAIFLVNKSENALKTDDRYHAIKYAYEALTAYKDDIIMPYTQEAEYQLTESLGIYDAGISYKAISGLQTSGVVQYIKTNSNMKYGAIYDESETLTLFNTKKMKKIKKYSTNSSYDKHKFSFIGKDKFAFINDKGNISIVNVKDGKLIKEIKKNKNSYKSVAGEDSGKYLIYKEEKKLIVYNINENKIIGEITTNDQFMDETYFNDDSNYIYAFTNKKSFNLNKEDNITMHVIKTNSAKEINNIKLNAGYIEGIATKNNNIYLLLNNMPDKNFNMLVVSYDYINGNTNWSKSYDGNWGKFITKSFPKNSNDIAIVNNNVVNVLNMDTGELVESFNTSSEIIGIYSYLNTEAYLAFSKDGSVNYLSMKYKKNIEYIGKYEFNLENYSKVDLSEKGFILIPDNENRIILYERKTNKNVKEEKINLDYVKDNSISSLDFDKINEKYKVKNRSLVTKIFYDKKKETMFINYTNGDIAIYDVKSKKLLKKLKKVGKVNHYFGKDKYDRTYIGDDKDSYILDNKYNKVGHIKGLTKLEKDKVIISNNKKYYSIKIYTLKEMLKEAKNYLK